MIEIVLPVLLTLLVASLAIASVVENFSDRPF